MLKLYPGLKILAPIDDYQSDAILAVATVISKRPRVEGHWLTQFENDKYGWPALSLERFRDDCDTIEVAIYSKGLKGFYWFGSTLQWKRSRLFAPSLQDVITAYIKDGTNLINKEEFRRLITEHRH